MKRKLFNAVALVAILACASCGGGSTSIAPGNNPPPGTNTNQALRFYGNGVKAPDLDRVKIRIDDPANALPGPPADVGATDFTIEFWMMANAGENTAGPITCGNGNEWINGNIVIDRDRYNQGRAYGVSIVDGVLAFGIDGTASSFTICSSTFLLDGLWHHIAVQRRVVSGLMEIFVDGQLEAQAAGPSGDISYPDNGVPGNFCNGPCTNSDPFIVIGAEKHDAGIQYPAYSGWIDELRISTIRRYGAAFALPGRFSPDGNTAALYHFDEGSGTDIIDATPGNRSPGVLQFGGNPAGPEWQPSTAPTAMP